MVLRGQPRNMYAFIADYLDALMITRENARVAAKLIQSITEITTTTVEFLKNTGMDRAEADCIVEIIQRTFRKHIEVQSIEVQPEGIEEANIISNIIDEANISPDKAEEAAVIIQRAYRNFKMRRDKERELLSGMIDWRIAARSAIELYRKTGVTNEEANRAATLIKAAYKGYYTRRVLRKLVAETKFYEEMQPEEFLEEEEEHTGVRSVSIDYDTVIPHVDFDETGDSEATEVKKEGSTTSAVVAYAIQGIIDAAFPAEEDITPKATEMAPKTTPIVQPKSEALSMEDLPQVIEQPIEIIEIKEDEGVIEEVIVKEEVGVKAEVAGDHPLETEAPAPEDQKDEGAQSVDVKPEEGAEPPEGGEPAEHPPEPIEPKEDDNPAAEVEQPAAEPTAEAAEQPPAEPAEEVAA